jgi:hypothetical protein
VLPAKFVSPLYAAEIDSVPTGSTVVVSVAALPLRETVPSVVPPLLNRTVPVGVPANCPETVAVKVRYCPASDGFCDEIKFVEEVALLTDMLSADEVLREKLISPP